MLRKLRVVMIALVIGFNAALTVHAETRPNLVDGQTTENTDGVSEKPIASESNSDASEVVSAKEVILVLNNIDDLNRLGIEEQIVKVYASTSMVKIKVPEGQSAASLITKYEHSHYVRYAYEETVVTISYTPTDPSYAAKQWNLQRIALEPIWDLTKGSPSVIVAVIDSGVGPHADIDGLVKGVDVTGSSGAACLSQNGEDNTPGQCSFDGGNHGTAVAAVIAANMNTTGIAGIAPNVSIMPVKIFAKGSLTTGSAEFVSGIKWAVDHGADIINISGGSYNRVQAEEDIINYALERGVIIVAASGNDGSQATWPAAYDGVIAVGSIKQEDYLSTFSNWMSNYYGILAPGEGIYLPDRSSATVPYVNMDGTSFSAPTVTGILALLMSKYPNYDKKTLERIVLTGTDKFYYANYSTRYGFGLVNALRAFTVADDARMFDQDDTIETAKTIEMNRLYTASLFPVYDVDYVKFTASVDMTNINLRVVPLGLQDMQVVGYNSVGTILCNAVSVQYYMTENCSFSNVKAGEVYTFKIYERLNEASRAGYTFILIGADTTAPIIEATSLGEPVADGATLGNEVNMTIKDSSSIDISVTKDASAYLYPADGTFSENGVYVVTATDMKNNVSIFNFTIARTDLSIVTFDRKDASTMLTKAVTSGTVVTRPIDPIRDGYDFAGWYASTGYTNLFDFATPIASDTTIFAKWNVKAYNVYFDSMRGTTHPAIQKLNYGSKIVRPANPVRDLHFLVGWYKDEALKTRFNFASDTVQGSTILYAKWHLNLATPVVNLYQNSANSFGVSFDLIDEDVRHEIYRATSATGPFTKIADIGYEDFSDFTVSVGPVYYYKVRSYVVTDTTTVYTAYSAVKSGQIAPLLTGGFTVTPTGFTSIQVDIEPSPSFSGFEIYASSDFAGTWSLICTTIVPTCIIGNLTKSSYLISYRAYLIYNGAKVFTQFSTSYDWYPSLNTPMSAVQVASASVNSLNVSWPIVSGAQGYEVYTSLSEAGEFALSKTVTATSATISGLTTNVPVFVKVRAYKSSGVYSLFSNIASARPIPSAPILQSTVVDYETLKLTWSTISGAVGYELSKYDVAESLYEVLYDGDMLEFVDTGLATGTSQSYKIRAYILMDDVRLYGSESIIHTNKPLPGVCATINAEIDSYTSIKLRYTPVLGASGYEVARSATATGVYATIGTSDTYEFVNYGLAFNTTYYYKVRAFALVDTVKIYGGYTSAIIAKTTLNTPIITPISSGYDRITVSWPAVTGISGYEVYQSTSSAGVYTLLATTTSTSYTKTALFTNTNYFYKVRAYRLVGTVRVYSSYSTIQSARPVPAMPVATASSASYNSLKVAWAAIAGATGYEVSYTKDIDGVYTVLPLQAAVTYTLAGQTTNELVYFKVRAYRLVGTTKVFGNSSSIVSAKPIPSTPVLTVASDNYNRLKISWAAIAGASGYELYVLNPTSSLYELLNEGTELLYLHADRISGVNHSYKIKAFTLVDTVKVYSNDSAVVTNKAIPIVPLSPKAVFANYTSITVSYTAVDGASGYEIYRSTTAAGVYTLVTSPTGTSYTNTGLAFNTTYYYKVRAFALVDTVKIYGGYTSAIIAKTTLNTPIITPISSGYDRITVSWPAVTGISGYEVYQSTSSAGVYTLLISTAATSYTKTALLTNTNYFYKVRAYRLVGTVRVYSSYSTIQSARPVPAVPVATASSASYNSLKVAWPAIAGATGYEVSYSKIFDGIYTILPVQAATSYTLAGQTTNELVYFKVRAYRLVGTLKVFGNSSSIVSAKPIPSTPVLTVTSDNYNRLKISWAAIAGASGYELYVLNPTSGLYELLNEGTALLYLHADRISGVNHSYKIKAFTLVDTVKVYSNDSTVVTNKAIPSVPALPKAVYTNYTSITVSYTAVDGASGYEIYRSTTAAGVYVLVTSPTGTSYTNTGLAFNTTYYYKVRAFTWVGAVKVYGNYTAVVSAKTTLNTPVATAVSASYNSIRISWPAIAGITRYELYRASSAAGVYTLLASLTTPTYTHAALATNTTYYYKVRAYRLVGIVKVYSSYSGVVNAHHVPATPIVSAANVNYNSVKASWAVVGGATGYEVSYAKIIDGIYTALPVQAAASYTLTGQTTNEPVYFKVRAYRLVGTVKVFGLASSIVSATPYPAAPVISAVPNIDKVTLTWLAIPGITKYTIYHKEDGAVDYTLLGETTGLTYVHESLTLNSIHNYKVVGSLMVDTTELLTSDSNTLLVTVAAPAVSGLTAVSTAYDTINLRWNASVGATGYEVSMATSSAGVYTPLLETDQLSFVKTGLSFNTTYYFKVRPFTLDGATKIYGLSASIVSAKTTLGTPLVTSKSLSATSINLTWLAIPGASGYEVYRSTTLTGTAVLQSTLTASTYTKTVLIKGTVYYYKVRAYRLVGTVKVYGAFSTNKYVRVGY